MGFSFERISLTVQSLVVISSPFCDHLKSCDGAEDGEGVVSVLFNHSHFRMCQPRRFFQDRVGDDHLAEIVAKIYYVRRNAKAMAELLEKAQGAHHEERAMLYFDELKPLMEHIRKHVDQLECVVSDEHWDLPKYREMLFIK